MLAKLCKNSDTDFVGPTAVADVIDLKPTAEVIDLNPPSPVQELSVYGSFSLAGAEFALSATSIQEVVNEPDSYSSIPLAPKYLLGVFNLRGSIVPVIDLRKIFSLNEESRDEGVVRKVAIIEYGELCLGVLFDSTGEIFNSNEVEKCLFESRGESAEQQVITGVFKIDGGKRIIQILDVYGMLNLESMPHSKSEASGRAVRVRGKRNQCIAFYIGETCCAIDIGSIREIVSIDSISNTLLASDLCLGAIDIRGDTVPIVDSGLLMGDEKCCHSLQNAKDSHSVIVMKVQNNLIGLLVNSIENIVTYFDDELVKFPVLSEKKVAMFEGCVPSTTGSEHTIVLKSSEFLSGDEIAQITRGHSQLFNRSSVESNRDTSGILDRKTLIVFSIEKRYGLDISDVREVIDYPEEMIHAPAMSGNICGMANLRGVLVPIIDSRMLYNMESNERSDSNKVLIFEQDGLKQGLVVDSVDTILSFSRSEVATIPEVVFGGKGESMSRDVKEAILVKNAEGNEDTVCILDLEAVSTRAAA